MSEASRKRKNLSSTPERRSSSRTRVGNTKYKDFCPVEDLFTNRRSSVASSSSRKIPESNNDVVNLEKEAWEAPEQNVPANVDLHMALAPAVHSQEMTGENSSAAPAKRVQVARIADAGKSQRDLSSCASLRILAKRLDSTASALSLSTSHLHPVSSRAKPVIQKILNLLNVNLKDFSQQQIAEFTDLVDLTEHLKILEQPQREVLLDMASQLPHLVTELQWREALLGILKKTLVNLEECVELSKMKQLEADEAQKQIDGLNEEEQQLKRRLQECRAKKEEIIKQRDQLNAESSALIEALPEKRLSTTTKACSNMVAMSSLETAWNFLKTSLERILNFVK